jgi:ABC-type transporter Mla subunit MlaD
METDKKSAMWVLVLVAIVVFVVLLRFSSVQEFMSLTNSKAQTGTPLMQYFWGIYNQPLVDNSGVNIGKVVGIIVMVIIVIAAVIYWNKR